MIWTTAGPPLSKRIKNSDLVPQPNYVLNTSPDKFQVVWKVEGITLEEAEALQHAMVREFGGDPAATDSTRVLRLPGFANKKYDQDFYVQARAESTQTYHLRDFKVPIDSQDAPRHHNEETARSHRAPGTALSQSEHDWAYAKRALARGDDPEEVIRRIADYRANDKSESPEKFQVVWKAEGITPEDAEALQHAMVREFGGDPAATDSTRVLRLPGFANKKYERDFYVQASVESTQTYHLRDFKVPIDSQDAPRHHGEETARNHRAPGATLSQSEHDWAYAKRALARGDDTEEIIRRIADFARKTNRLLNTTPGTPSRRPRRTYNAKLPMSGALVQS